MPSRVMIPRRRFVVHEGRAQLTDRYVSGVLSRKPLPKVLVDLPSDSTLGHHETP
jgi:hypothetical protein